MSQMTGMVTGLVGYMIHQELEELSRRILRLSHTHRIPRIIMGGANRGGAPLYGGHHYEELKVIQTA